eukprot:3921465-Pleurochrysis_carterae.AAC.1
MQLVNATSCIYSTENCTIFKNQRGLHALIICRRRRRPRCAESIHRQLARKQHGGRRGLGHRNGH